jgi:hypothetical protein
MARQENLEYWRGLAKWGDEQISILKAQVAASEREMKMLREALHKIAEIEHEDIPKPTTPNEGYTWTVLAMAVELAEKALKEKP